MPDYDYLIVGGGMTAAAAIGGINEVDEGARIKLISAELDPPYDRPPLSKGLWAGEELHSIWRHVEAGVEYHLGTRVMHLDPMGRTVFDGNGRRYGYRRLLLATGGEPRRLPGDEGSIIYYRTLEDYRRLSVLTQEREHFLVIGGGFIGSEIAAALCMKGRKVTMIFPEDGIGAAVFPIDLSQFITGYYRERGIDVRTRTRVADVRKDDDRNVVTTTDGDRFIPDAVVAGIGTIPNATLAAKAGLRVGYGIMVDASLRTSRPDIFAAGDVASFYNRALGEWIRVEHADNANIMGRLAGRAMAGDHVQYTRLPFFYSDLFDLGYEGAGYLDSRLQTEAVWEEPFRKGVIYYLEEGRIRGALLWDTREKVDAARQLIIERKRFEPRSIRGGLQN